MTVNAKTTGRASSVPAGLASGVITAVAVMLAGTLITALMISEGVLRWNNSGYGVMVTLILSSWVGAAVAAGKVKRRRLLICASAGGVYFAVLLVMTGLFFGGKFSGVGETGLLILCGSTLGFFLKYPAKSERNRRKIRRYHG
jgi:putative membrane protein (TIGR04086 family)